jgi:hypothetical protein
MKTENGSFVVFDKSTTGLLYNDESNPDFPIRYYNVVDGIGAEDLYKENCSYFGYVYSGNAVLDSQKRPFQGLCNGMYFAISEPFKLHQYELKGSLVIVEVLNTLGVYPNTSFKSMYAVGGPIEEKGRLKYIDGCTDSLLIAPVKKGDPCLNHLHFPPGIDQTQHTHPSHRIGIVAKGYGECITPFGNMPLVEGTIFIIKAWDGVSYSTAENGMEYPIGQHAFKTPYQTSMDVIAFHPDSDFGATDEVHPMINRTIVDGVSASLIDSIRTK